jgi:putative SOS response-associated peptidase YedK
MCSRFTLRTVASDLVEIFVLPRDPEVTPRFQVAPTSRATAVRQSGAAREISSMRRGLVPRWSKDAKVRSALMNARADTVAARTSFGSAFQRRRCLDPVDGLFEWERLLSNLLCFGAKMGRVSKGQR